MTCFARHRPDLQARKSVAYSLPRATCLRLQKLPKQVVNYRLSHTLQFHTHASSHADEDHLYGFSRVKKEEEEVECLLPLSGSGGLAVAVFDLEGVVCVVREWGQLEVFLEIDTGWRHTGTVCLGVALSPLPFLPNMKSIF